MADRSAHLAWLSLRRRAGTARLTHRGTGEIVDLIGEVGLVDLQFCPEGRGILVPQDGGPPHWASDKLRYDLRVDDESNSLLALDTEAGTTLPWSEVFDTKLHRTFSHTVNGITFESYVVHVQDHRHGLAPWCWWSMPHLFDRLFGQYESQFICRRYHSWESILLMAGLGGDHIKRSWKSLCAAARESEQSITFQDLAETDQEFALSTSGFFAMLVLLPYTKIGRNADGLAGKAKQIFELCMDCFCKSADIAFHIPTNDGTMEVMLRGDKVFMQSFADVPRFIKDGLQFTVDGDCNTVPMWDLLGRLIDVIMRSSRYKVGAAGRSTECLKGFTLCMGDVVDSSRDDDVWQHCTALEVKPLVGSKGGRRISQQYKRAITEAASSSEVGVTPRALVASMTVTSRAKRQRTVSASCAKHFSHDNLFLYNATALKISAGCKDVAIAADGVRVGGEETMVMFGTLPEVGVTSVMPPQVLPDGKNTLNT